MSNQEQSSPIRPQPGRRQAPAEAKAGTSLSITLSQLQPDLQAASSILVHLAQKSMKTLHVGLAKLLSVQATEGDADCQRRAVCIQHSTHLLITHPLFPPDTSNASETSMVEYRKWLDNLSADRPGLATLKWIIWEHEPNDAEPKISADFGFETKPVLYRSSRCPVWPIGVVQSGSQILVYWGVLSCDRQSGPRVQSVPRRQQVNFERNAVGQTY